ncbi:hypothetical protein K466DRAFT_579691 [Polyporus arcularius HHB13444]|uniref:Uncharacterized protein n=1 Tax=Polyporus arcularius HHB13444 TaxID=1314778 RepID=A0A5C3Q8N5_9APHY|nr:hypothetical protein K466DRAFT_579691 [Polyporus arcularius HHB13444]
MASYSKALSCRRRISCRISTEGLHRVVDVLKHHHKSSASQPSSPTQIIGRSLQCRPWTSLPTYDVIVPRWRAFRRRRLRSQLSTGIFLLPFASVELRKPSHDSEAGPLVSDASSFRVLHLCYSRPFTDKLRMKSASSAAGWQPGRTWSRT